jgi:hypothetical protein
MTMQNRAVLTLEDKSDNYVSFEFDEFDILPTTDTQYLIGGQGGGQLIGELADFIPSINSQNKAGYAVDAGLGSQIWELSATLGPEEPAFWGPVDSDANGDPTSTPQILPDEPDAHDVSDPAIRVQVLQYWLVNTAIDSLDATGEATLRWGEHTDGIYDSTASIAELSPVPVGPQTLDIRDVRDDPSVVEVDLTLLRLEGFPTDGGLVSVI